jgi:ferredoxin, 2Fe-2S
MKLHVTVAGVDRQIDADAGSSLLHAMRDAGVPVLAICNGACSCATCHVQIDPAWIDRLPPKQELEEETLDNAFDVRVTSRLACQVNLDETLDGLRLELAADATG